MTNKSIECEISCIFSYDNKSQQMANIKVTIRDDMPEKEFLTMMFDQNFGSIDDLGELDDLRCLSCCITGNEFKNGTIFMDHYMRRSGKYYFDNEKCNDPEQLSSFKKNYVMCRK